MTAAIVERPPNHLPAAASGDHLSRAEFERRWETHPETKRAERIGGIVYVAFSVSNQHAEATGCPWAGS
jgi:hypothetical protein